MFEMDQNNNKPQLFINFRGQDERLKLLPHLKHHLKGSKVTVFTDEDAIGEPLENLYKHIRRSRIVMVIFSMNFLTSEWCLKELVEIRKCLMTEKVDYAIPIFYNVRASHVKDQTGDFGEKFLALQNKFPESIKKWTKALIFVAKYVGLSYDKNGSITELDFCKRVVERVDLVLTKITSKEWPNNHNNNSSVSTKTSQGEALTLNKFDDINRLYHFSKTLEALDLQRQNLENYNRGVYLSRNYPSYYEEPSWILDDNVPQDWPHYDHRRTNSYPDSIYQIYPPLDDTKMVQNHPSVPQMSIENFPQAVVQNHPVVTHVGIDTNLRDTVVQNPGVTQSRNDNILQDEMIEVQSPAATQVSNDNAKRNEDIHLLQRFIKWQGRSLRKVVKQVKHLKGEVKSLKDKFSGAGYSNPQPDEVVDSVAEQTTNAEDQGEEHMEEHMEERHSFHGLPSSQPDIQEPPRASLHEHRQRRKRRATRSPTPPLPSSSDESYTFSTSWY